MPQPAVFRSRRYEDRRLEDKPPYGSPLCWSRTLRNLVEPDRRGDYLISVGERDRITELGWTSFTSTRTRRRFVRSRLF